jgi:hypothetical protein
MPKQASVARYVMILVLMLLSIPLSVFYGLLTSAVIFCCIMIMYFTQALYLLNRRVTKDYQTSANKLKILYLYFQLFMAFLLEMGFANAYLCYGIPTDHTEYCISLLTGSAGLLFLMLTLWQIAFIHSLRPTWLKFLNILCWMSAVILIILVSQAVIKPAIVTDWQDHISPHVYQVKAK